MVDSTPNSTNPEENHLILPTFDPKDSALFLLQDYLKFYSFQDYRGKVKYLTDFTARTPFELYYKEHTKPQADVEGADRRRFG